MVRQDFGVNTAFANTPGNDLGVLRSEIQNSNAGMGKGITGAHRRSGEYGTKRENYLQKKIGLWCLLSLISVFRILRRRIGKSHRKTSAISAYHERSAKRLSH